VSHSLLTLMFTVIILNFFLILLSIYFITSTTVLEPLTISCGEIQWHSSSTLGLSVVPVMSEHGPLPKAILEYRSTLKGLFTRMCSYEVILPDMTTRSVFSVWITDLTSSVTWPLIASSTDIPCFLENTLGSPVPGNL
jgi:hypothetical protein